MVLDVSREGSSARDTGRRDGRVRPTKEKDSTMESYLK